MAQNISTGEEFGKDYGGSFATAGQEAASAADLAADAADRAAQAGNERYAAMRGRLREQWSVAKKDLGQFKRRAADYSQSAAKATDAYAHDHPWRTAGAAVGVGALLGWLISRR